MILVTGGTGNSGVPIVEALLEHAARVRVLARDPEKAAHLLGNEVERPIGCSLKLVVSTTRVSPSHRPTEWPCRNVSVAGGCFRASR